MNLCKYIYLTLWINTVCHGECYRWVQPSVRLYAEIRWGCDSSDHYTAWFHRTDLQQACRHMWITVRTPTSPCSHQWFSSRCSEVLDLLCGVCCSEPWTCPSPLISRWSPDRAAYRCRSRTTGPQWCEVGGPCSGRGTQTTPTARNILVRDTETTSSSMVWQILWGSLLPSVWSEFILTQLFKRDLYQQQITLFPRASSTKQTTTHPCTIQLNPSSHWPGRAPRCIQNSAKLYS